MVASSAGPTLGYSLPIFLISTSEVHFSCWLLSPFNRISMGFDWKYISLKFKEKGDRLRHRDAPLLKIGQRSYRYRMVSVMLLEDPKINGLKSSICINLRG